MGVLYEYFSASSDEVAATAINRIGGPSAPSKDTPPLPAFDTFRTKVIDPNVTLGNLEARLTGRDDEEIDQGPRAGKPLAVEDDGALMVVTLTDELQTALADADPEGLGPWLGELAKLARRARNRGERLYCWVCI
jgi:hypothetical protein